MGNNQNIGGGESRTTHPDTEHAMNATTRNVRITSSATGTNFGYAASVRALNNRVLASTDVYGTRDAAITAARDIARRNGWTVRA
jgi:uncharacterized protein (DUF1786 family)